MSSAPSQQDGRSIAVIGSGVSGLTAAWLLRNTATVTLFEAEDRLGGHAHTHTLDGGDGRQYGVDSGFIVHNRKTYPNLLRLFDELGVATQESEMSMSINCAGCGLQYAGGKKAGGLFAQRKQLLNLRYLRMLREVVRFNAAARKLITEPTRRDANGNESTLADFVAAGGYSQYFKDHFLTPLVAAVWSTAPDVADRYPAQYLFRFLDNHGMLTVKGAPTWRTVTGGSRSYVEKVGAGLPEVLLDSPVVAVHRESDEHGNRRVRVVTDGGLERSFDGVVIATHPGQALKLLADPSAEETELLGAFEYSPNPTVLHTDTAVMPTSKAAWASWNYRMDSCGGSGEAVQVSYHMNRLQRLDSPTQFLVSLNDDGAIPESKVLARMGYEHPIYTPESVAAQSRLPELNTGVTAFAGAYHGWGFHEDGCTAGVKAAQSLGGRW